MDCINYFPEVEYICINIDEIDYLNRDGTHYSSPAYRMQQELEKDFDNVKLYGLVSRFSQEDILNENIDYPLFNYIANYNPDRDIIVFKSSKQHLSELINLVHQYDAAELLVTSIEIIEYENIKIMFVEMGKTLISEEEIIY